MRLHDDALKKEAQGIPRDFIPRGTLGFAPATQSSVQLHWARHLPQSLAFRALKDSARLSYPKGEETDLSNVNFEHEKGVAGIR